MSRNRAISRRIIRYDALRDSEIRPRTVVILRFLLNFEQSLSLQVFGSSKPNVYLGLILYDELCDIAFYWDSLPPIRQAISKHLFLKDYTDATAHPVLDAIFWSHGRSSHTVFPRPSAPTSRLLTLVNPEGRLRIAIMPDGEHPTHYPHPLHAPSITSDTLSWLDHEFRTPSARLAQPLLKSLALAVYRIVMVASAGSTIISQEFEESSVLGELVVENSARAFWGSNVQFRHHLPVSPQKSYKWTWYNNSMEELYHGIPGWTRFTLRRRNSGWTRAINIILGDEGNDVDNWSVLLACLSNWVQADADLRTFCLDHCTGHTQIGFVTQIDVSSYVHGGFAPLPGYDAADTVYLFIEDLRVGADGRIAPCRRFHSLDRTGATPMSVGLMTLYGVDQTSALNVRKRVQFFECEQFAVLDEMWTRFGNSDSFGVSPLGPWTDVRPSLKRSQSAMRLDTVDWRTDWMWEDHNREAEKASRGRWISLLRYARKRRPELHLPVEQEPAQEEEVPEAKDPVRRLHRSKTKSVGGGLSLIFSRLVL
ncbi:hypothetical protein B0H11DRAFT_2106329 [Mycena galericulata]|nr:hypothetical protein B0H11DRAFT_2106329 [Mycena galericulata]